MPYANSSGGASAYYGGSNASWGAATSYSGDLTLTGTITPLLESSDSETKPSNFTYKIWLRTA